MKRAIKIIIFLIIAFLVAWAVNWVHLYDNYAKILGINEARKNIYSIESDLGVETWQCDVPKFPFGFKAFFSYSIIAKPSVSNEYDNSGKYSNVYSISFEKSMIFSSLYCFEYSRNLETKAKILFDKNGNIETTYFEEGTLEDYTDILSTMLSQMNSKWDL